MLLSKNPILFTVKKQIFAEIAFRKQQKERESFFTNFKSAFPLLSSEDLQKKAKNNWHSQYFNYCRVQVLKRISKQKIRQYLINNIDIERIENLKSACQENQPIVFFTPHFGDFIAGSLRLGIECAKHKPINVFYQHPKDNPSNADFKPIIDKCDFPPEAAILYDSKAILKGLRALKKGQALIMFSDLAEMNEASFFIPFFNRLILAMGGTAFFAIKSGAKIIPYYCIPSKLMKSKLIIEAPLEIPTAENLEDSIYLLTKTIFANMENQFKKTPEHWHYWAKWHQWTPVNKSFELDYNAWNKNIDEMKKVYFARQPKLNEFLEEFETKIDSLKINSAL